MINWQYFPKSDSLPENLFIIVNIFKKHNVEIDSQIKNLDSNTVLSVLRQDLVEAHFLVEQGKKIEDKIKVPVLFGKNGQLEKSFHVDAFNKETGTILEVEAGRAVVNNQFLKDLFEACMMHGVNFLVIAVRNIYLKKPDFETVITHFETLYASGRLVLPLKGVLIIGY
ncbi:MAG: hypothetical protein IAX22_06585 [Candidatus Bathyarchaeota archaeon]|nr:hypothetical protein [Candidatus Bathyarchaeota archaeon]